MQLALELSLRCSHLHRYMLQAWKRTEQLLYIQKLRLMGMRTGENHMHIHVRMFVMRVVVRMVCMVVIMRVIRQDGGFHIHAVQRALRCRVRLYQLLR